MISHLSLIRDFVWGIRCSFCSIVFVFTTSIFGYKRFARIFIEGCIRNKQTIDEFPKKERRRKSHKTISNFYYLPHLSCSLLRRFFLSFLQDRYRLWPFFKAILVQDKDFNRKEKREHEARRRIFHEKSVDESSLSLTEETSTRKLPCNFMQISNQSQFIKYANNVLSSKLNLTYLPVATVTHKPNLHIV